MKKIGETIYIHRSNVDILTQEQLDLMCFGMREMICSIYYTMLVTFEIIKINTKTNSVTFIDSPDWNSAREPVVGNACKISSDGKVKLIKKKSSPQIYHHKWMFVSDSYDGFDVEESKKWSEKWQSTIPKGHSNKIGYKKYWDELLVQFGLDVE